VYAGGQAVVGTVETVAVERLHLRVKVRASLLKIFSALSVTLLEAFRFGGRHRPALIVPFHRQVSF